MTSPHTAVVDTSHSPYARLRPVPADAVQLAGGFWAPRLHANAADSIPQQYELLKARGALDNFRRLYGASHEAAGFVFRDSDLYKWIEAASYALLDEEHAPEIRPLLDEAIDAILPAQGEDGYLNSYFGNDPANRFHNIERDHELYCAGHYFQAAIAHHRVTGETRLLDSARRFADYLATEFAPGKREEPPGHPEIELALVELYRETGEARYLELARFFLEQIGIAAFEKYEGHAVRAAYCASGATDYYLETGEARYLDGLECQWQDLMRTKVYVTGGLGGRYHGESVGSEYELPNQRAYAETCAALALIFWDWRMLQVAGDARYADALEHTLYNGALSGVSLDGTTYFYVNPLADHGHAEGDPWYPWARREPYQRKPVYACNCCPPNVERFLASLPGYMLSTDADGVWVHLYDASETRWTLPNGAPFTLTQRTRYPWEGEVEIELGLDAPAEFTLHLRIPGWTPAARVHVEGDVASESDAQPGSYLALRRTWQPGDCVRLRFEMPVTLLEADDRVPESRGSVAVQRGPVIYCAEGVDHGGADVRTLRLNANTAIGVSFEPDLLGGVAVLRTKGRVRVDDEPADALYHPRGQGAAPAMRLLDVQLVPYYAWANRGAASMAVWLQLDDPAPA